MADSMIRVTRLKLKNYRGIATLDEKIEGAGVLARGRNGSGKTSVLRAIGSCLASTDVGPDALRIGEEEGEILIDLDVADQTLHVRRRFGTKKSNVEVTTGAGDIKKGPAKVLSDLLGSAPLDVVSLVLEKDKKARRSLILAALPVRVTVEQLRRWVPELAEDYDVSGHGLEVIERLRKTHYDRRTAANKAAEDAAETAKRGVAAAKAARAQVPAGAPTDLDATRAEHTAAQRELDGLRARKEAATSAIARTEGLRTQAGKLRAQAAKLREWQAPSMEQLSDAAHDFERQQEKVDELRRQLAAEVARLEELHKAVGDLRDKERVAIENAEQAEELEHQAKEIEHGIAAAVDQVSDEEIEKSRQRTLQAAERANAAVAVGDAVHAEEKARMAAEAADVAKKEAERLDAIVVALSKDAPGALLAETPGVSNGLEIDGDDIRLGGVSLDKLCGQEQVAFAAEIAKALNPHVGFMVVDGLERLDPEQLDTFIGAATSGGRQLFGSIVDRGELVLAHIAQEPSSQEAAE